MTKFHTPLALVTAVCAALAACGGGSGQTDDAPSSSQLNSGNALEAIAISQRAQDSVLVVNNLFRLASIEVLTDLPAKTAGACPGGGDFSYATTAQQQSLQLRQCQMTRYNYRKGTLTSASAAAGSTLTLVDVGFDRPQTGMSFDVSGQVGETISGLQQMSWSGEVRIASGAHSDTWKYSLQTPAMGGSVNAVTGEMSLQSSRLKVPLAVRWLAGNPALVIQAPDGSSVTVTLDGMERGTAQLRSTTGGTTQLSFSGDELVAAMRRWTY